MTLDTTIKNSIPMLLLLLSISLFINGCNSATDNSKSVQLLNIVSHTVSPPSRKVSTFSGVIHARMESDLAFRVAGKIENRLVNTGEHVSKGQLLLTLDQTDFALALEIANAEIEAANAKLHQLLAEEKRQAELVKVRAISQKSYELALSALKSSQAQLKAVKARANQISNQSKYTSLFADADGVILDIYAEVGQVVDTGQKIVQLAQDGAREALVNLPEKYAFGAPHYATAVLYAAPEKSYTAELREYSARANSFSRTYQARYKLKGDPAKIPLGATVNLTFQEEAIGIMAEVPIAAIFDDRNGNAVWVIDPDTSTVTQRPVQISSLSSQVAQISSGLVQGEIIVAMGANLLQEGQLVTIAQKNSVSNTINFGLTK